MDVQKNRNTALQIVILYILVQLLTVIVGQLLPESIRTVGVIWTNMLLFALGAILMIYITHKRNFTLSFEQPFRQDGGMIITWGILGVFIALFAQGAAAIIEINFLGTPIDSQNTQTLLAIIEQYPYFILLTSITGPIMEEFVFRKAVFGMAVGKIGAVGAAVVSSLLFAMIHFDGRILVYSTMGLVFSWLYYKTKNIWTPIIAHCLMNSIVAISNIIQIN